MEVKGNMRRRLIMAFAALTLAIGLVPVSTQQRVDDYDPWYDLNDDGEIDIFDIIAVATRFRTSGEPFDAKAAIEHDSGWVDITDKAGQYFNITHNLNSTDVMVYIQGKTVIEGGVHQRLLGFVDYMSGWSRAYQREYAQEAMSVVQTSDGGYARARGREQDISKAKMKKVNEILETLTKRINHEVFSLNFGRAVAQLGRASEPICLKPRLVETL